MIAISETNITQFIFAAEDCDDIDFILALNCTADMLRKRFNINDIENLYQDYEFIDDRPYSCDHVIYVNPKYRKSFKKEMIRQLCLNKK